MPQERDLRVIPIREGSTVTGWQLEVVDTGQKGQNGNFPKVHLQKHSGKTDFTVTITDPQDQVTFPTLPEDAIWVKEVQSDSEGSPTEKGIKTDQIVKVELPNDTQLTFTDLNKGGPRKLSYQLNFDGAPPLDPIIENGGGTGGGNFYDYIQSHPVESGIIALLMLTVLFALIRDKMTLKKGG